MQCSVIQQPIIVLLLFIGQSNISRLLFYLSRIIMPSSITGPLVSQAAPFGMLSVGKYDPARGPDCSFSLSSNSTHFVFLSRCTFTFVFLITQSTLYLYQMCTILFVFLMHSTVLCHVFLSASEAIENYDNQTGLETGSCLFHLSEIGSYIILKV